MTDRSSLRLFVLRVFVVALLVTLFGRLWYLQVLGGEDYAQAASANRVRPVVEAAPRGEVLDARGRPLVRNRTALVVSVDRSTLLRQPDDGRAVLERLAAVVGRPADELSRAITPLRRRRHPAVLARLALPARARSPSTTRPTGPA
jgi:penicillin-binding protein 2